MLDIQWTGYDDAIAYDETCPQSIKFVVLGTDWSQTCIYTIRAVQQLIQEEKYKDKVTAVFVNEDKDTLSCAANSIPVGFPALIVFEKQYVIPFIDKMSGFEPNEVTKKLKIVRQLNIKQLRQIADCAIQYSQNEISEIPIPE